MELSTISVGMSVSQENSKMRGNLYDQWGAVFIVTVFHGKQENKENRSFGVGTTVEGEFWSISGAKD